MSSPYKDIDTFERLKDNALINYNYSQLIYDKDPVNISYTKRWEL